MAETEEAVCPCETTPHPRRVATPPGRSRLDRRIGDFVSFRHALLRGLPGETALSGWRPAAEDDLGVQMVEWWAYLADILTFYDERIADESYLNTATLPENVRAIIRLLGYRPRPGIGATGLVGALLANPVPPQGVTLPPHFPIQSKPGPGQEPQIFETDAATPLPAPDVLSVEPEPNTELTQDGNSVHLAGAVSVQVGEKLLLVKRGWDATVAGQAAWAEVETVKAEKDPHGRPLTRVTFRDSLSLASGAAATEYRLLRSTRTAHLYQLANDGLANPSGVAHLDSLYREIAVGDPVYVESDHPGAVSVTGYTEVVWYMNNPSAPATNPGTATAAGAVINPGVPALHSQIGYNPASVTTNKNTTFRFGFRDVGTLVAAPVWTVPASDSNALILPLAADAPDATPQRTVLIEDAAGKGVVGTVVTTRQITVAPPYPTLQTPLRALTHVLKVSRGQTVLGEVLGGGDARIAGQTFTLKKSPLTYLFDASAPERYRSTLLVRVNGVAWREVPNFLNAGPTDTVFVTAEDDAQRTHVTFGDGVRGARLPTGVDNVVASYRFGSGGAVPNLGAVTNILTPWPGLKALRNPTPMGGGNDPDPPQKIKQYAPRSVLTFGRAIGAADYETIAALTPGVARARAYWKFNEDTQRAGVTVYVGDDGGAADAAREALRGVADPNRPADVRLARAVRVALTLNLLYDPAREKAAVEVAVKRALLDPDTGLFGANVVRIGQSLFRSRLVAVCVGVPGVVAVRGLDFRQEKTVNSQTQLQTQTGFRFDPGEGNFYRLKDADGDLNISLQEATDAR